MGTRPSQQRLPAEKSRALGPQSPPLDQPQSRHLHPLRKYLLVLLNIVVFASVFVGLLKLFISIFSSGSSGTLNTFGTVLVLLIVFLPPFLLGMITVAALGLTKKDDAYWACLSGFIYTLLFVGGAMILTTGAIQFAPSLIGEVLGTGFTFMFVSYWGARLNIAIKNMVKKGN
jgi:hypothetical protein